MSSRDILLGLLAKYAYQYRPDVQFTLVSGAKSDEYLDCKLALSQPPAMNALGELVYSHLADVVAIGGLTMGSDPIAMATCAHSDGPNRKPVRWFAVRKEPKEHGQMRLIEGSVYPGEAVTVVDDVVTSGSSTIKAIGACRDAGLRVMQVIILVDRQQADGMEKIRQAAGPGVFVSAIFKKEEIHKTWIDQNHTYDICS